MTARELIDFMGMAERLKCAQRHCVTTTGRVESVAEHSWRLTLMAMLAAREVPGLDEAKLMKLCLLHDLGEAVTGDIPAFLKTSADEAVESGGIGQVFAPLAEPERQALLALYREFEAQETPEAKLTRALDKCEALLSHNEADIASWLPLEYDLQLTYGQRECAAFPFTQALRAALEADSRAKIQNEAQRDTRNENNA